jgi:hypothetical protein
LSAWVIVTAIDSKGNFYVGEVAAGERVQKLKIVGSQ